MGSSSFEALYQQRPTAREGGLFKRDWWKYFRLTPPVHTAVVQSWDTAFKKGEGNDYSVCTTWLVAGNGYYLIDRWKNKIEFPDLKRTAVNLAAMHNPHVILIEDKASGQSLIQELKRDTRLPIIPVTVDRDKEARANAVTAVVESGRVFLPEASDWTQDFVDELAAFPAGAHDDQVDSFTQAMNYFRENYTGVSVDTTGVSRVSSGAAIDRFTGGGQARRAIGAYMRA
jgi:predicted phage terminase large subunit-like protein